MTEVKVGTVIVSERGRDKGRIMAVLSVEGQYAFVADGRKRNVRNPKRKKLCHLSVLAGGAWIEIEEITNKALWKKLEPYRKDDTDSSET